MKPTRILLLILSLLTPSLFAAPKGTDLLADAKLAAHYYGADAPWFQQNIPFFDCSSPYITQIYYYRWELYKAHLKDLGDHGYITTEFLDDVSWARAPYQSLNDATAFHIGEGRWLRDPRYVHDYINFMYTGGNDRHFSEAIAAAAYGDFLADGDRAFAIQNLDAMTRIYHLWHDHLDTSKGLYFIEPLLDATEYSVASIDASGGKDGFRYGNAFRPTINSFMYANAVAISRLALLAGDTNTADEFASDAATLRANVESNLWNDQFQDFVDRYQANNQYVHYWDFIRARELCGYVPWAFELPDANPKYNAAWQWLLSTNDFAGPYGLRTVAPSYEYYMRQYRYDTVNGVKRPECEWNGPSWPFDTTLVLQAMANLLNDYQQDLITRDDYFHQLKMYTLQPFLGRPDLQEDYNPDTGAVIVGLPRSHHYNHSEYNDLIITGLVGLRPRADDTLEINPLIPVATVDDRRSSSTNPVAAVYDRRPESLGYFCLENVPYHGHLVTILYDRDGHRYGKGSGLNVYVDGNRVLKSAPLAKQLIPIPAPIVTESVHPIDLAVNCARKGFPVPSASVNNNPRDLFRAIDGRVWFFPEIQNFWSTTGTTNPTDWYALDFDTEKEFTSAQLYFYSDSTAATPHFAAPKKVVLQYWTNGDWQNIPHQKFTPSRPLANGQNTVTFPAIKTTQLRAVFTNPDKAAIALVELKVY